MTITQEIRKEAERFASNTGTPVDQVEANLIASRLSSLGAPGAVVRCVRARAVSLTKSRAVLEAYAAPVSAKPASRPAAHTPPKPTTPTPKAETMSNAQIKAVENEQRRAFLNQHPSLPRHLVAELASEPMSKVRDAVAAYEGGQGLPPWSELGGVIAQLGACLSDLNTPGDERARAIRALETFDPEDLPPDVRARLKQIQEIDLKMGGLVPAQSFGGRALDPNAIRIGSHFYKRVR